MGLDWTYPPAVDVIDAGCRVTETEDDPDGADRGGFHQQSHTVTVEGEKLLYSYEASDNYEERCGCDEPPDPACTSKEEALKWLRGVRADLTNKVKRLDNLLLLAEKTTTFASDFPERDEEDDDEEE